MAFSNFSQRDDRWKSQRLGTCDGVTIGSDGCFVTAYANIASHFSKQLGGQDITPANLDDFFTNNGMYVQGCLCTDSMLSNVFGDIQYIETFHFEDVPANFGVLVNTFEDEYVVEVDFSPNTPGVQTHFNRFYSYDANADDIYIIDSWTGLLTSVRSAYGDPHVAIQKIIHYRGPSPVTPPPTPAEPDPAPVTPPPPPPAPPKPDTPPPHDDPAAPPAQQPPEVTPTPGQPTPSTSPIELAIEKFIDWLIQAIKNLFKKGKK